MSAKRLPALPKPRARPALVHEASGERRCVTVDDSPTLRAPRPPEFDDDKTQVSNLTRDDIERLFATPIAEPPPPPVVAPPPPVVAQPRVRRVPMDAILFVLVGVCAGLLIALVIHLAT